MPNTIQKNNNTTVTADSAQNLWCRDTYWQHINTTVGFNMFKETNGCRLRYCNKSPNECRGAHKSEDIKPLSHISAHNRLDKSRFNWVQLYLGIVSCFQLNASKVLSEEHKQKIAESNTINFVELIQLWRDYACYYRKIKKDMTSNAQSTHISGYKRSDDVPGFYLDGTLEDTAWAFERLTRYCKTHKSMEQNIAQRQQITVWNLCLATGLNCKEGVHYEDEHICVSDFLTGKCSCMTKESLEAQECELQLKKIELTHQLTQLIETEPEKHQIEWASTNKKKKNNKSKIVDPKYELQMKIKEINSEIDNLVNFPRQIHYTESGMLPFETQLHNYHEAEKAIKPKESWDHGIMDVPTVLPKAIKVSKLGGKKK